MMHKLYELRDNLIKELETYADKQTLDLPTLDQIDKLAHASKNLCKVIESCEEEDGYSGGYPMGGRMMPHFGYSGRHRDSRGRYSRATDGFHMELQNLIDNAPNEQTRQKLMSAMNDL